MAKVEEKSSGDVSSGVVGSGAGNFGGKRGVRRNSAPQLNERQSFVRQTARTAKKAADLIIRRIERGDDVSSEAIGACTTLAGCTASLFLGD